MTYHWRIFTQVALALFCAAAACHPASEPKPVAKSGSTSVRATIRNHSVQVRFDTAKFTPADQCFPKGLAYFKEISLVQTLTILVDGKPVPVPRSVSAPLFDVWRASIDSKNKTFVLTIEGSDAAESYLVRLYFDSSRVLRKEVFETTAPQKPVEETVYHLESQTEKAD